MILGFPARGLFFALRTGKVNLILKFKNYVFLKIKIKKKIVL